MLSLRLLFIFAFTVFTVWAIDYRDVLADLQATDADVRTLTGQLNSYTGTGSQTVVLRNQVTKIQGDLNKATSDTNSATTPSAADATTVYNYVNGALLTDTRASLTAASNRRSDFQSAGVLNEFCLKVKDLKSRTDTLADALIAKAPNDDLKTKGRATKQSYDNAFNAAINALGPC